MEGDAPSLPLEPVAVEEGGDVVAAGEIAPAGQAAGEIVPAGQAARDFADRGWRGAFSPPTFTMEEFAEYQEHLVKPEEELLREIEAGRKGGGRREGGARRRSKRGVLTTLKPPLFFFFLAGLFLPQISNRMASGKETTVASSSLGEGSGGSQKAAEGVTVAVAPPPSSPLPVPQPAPMEEEMAEDKDSPAPVPPMENVMEGGAPPLPLEPVAVQEGGDDGTAGGWRGPFNPPTFTMEEFAEYQEHLVKPEEEQLREIEAEERVAAGERLNAEVAPVEEFILPDLNLPPPDQE
nr:hypothetical protein Iba_chr04cCG14920 [Ipomoea batatas]